MDNEKKINAIKKIQTELDRINKNENKVFFFVLDTEGYASGSLAYIYHLAKFAKDAGYNVGMLYQTEAPQKGMPEDEFVGVEGWLGKEYSSLPHYDIRKEEVDINPSDIVFIPEIFSQVMNQTKNLPCQRIAIMQNFDYVLSQMPYSAQWGDYNIVEAISNTEENAALIKSVFPYEKVTVIPPFIENIFGETKEPKKLVVNIVAHNQDDVTRLIKPFYWKYPLMKYVSFRHLSGFTKEKFADALRESFLTIWIDEPASFGYSAIEAMKCGNVVFAKVPNETKKWMYNEDGTTFNDSCIWFDNLNAMHDKIATMVRAFLTDSIPASVYEGQKTVKDMYPEEASRNAFTTYLKDILGRRKKSMETAIKIAESEINDSNKEKA